MVRCCSRAWRASEATSRGVRKNHPGTAEISHFGGHCIASESAISLTYSGLWQPEPRKETALKQTHEACRRGGESSVRNGKCSSASKNRDNYCCAIHKIL